MGELARENAFCVLMVLCGVFLFRILRPKDGIFTPHLKEHAGGWADRLRYLWYCGLAIGPCMLAVLSMMGYHYTAQRLAMHLHTSIITLVEWSYYTACCDDGSC